MTLTVRLQLIGVLLAAFAIPALGDGNPIPWPKKPAPPTLVATPSPQRLVADGNPIPWPKKPSQPTLSATPGPQKLLADGNPIPWPKKPSTPVP